MKTAVLLMAYGGPGSLNDVPDYLLDVRNGRDTPQALVDEITRRYRLIGGSSPLLGITRSAAARLQAELGMPVYVGMRHWHPYIREAVAEMAVDGIRHVIALCMAPHFSSMSIGAYRVRLEEALASVGGGMTADLVECWHTEPHYLNGLADNVHAALARFDDTSRVKIIFTAHSLPAAIVERGDPYPAQLHETAELLAARLALPADHWTFAYQSAAQTSVPWLGPQIEALVPELAEAGERNMLIAPVGFVADHLEVLYDLDIALQEIAARAGVRVERTAMLNDSPALVAALVAVAQQRLDL